MIDHRVVAKRGVDCGGESGKAGGIDYQLNTQNPANVTIAVKNPA
jgi:hypothetical protein